MSTEKKELVAKYEPAAVESAIWAAWEAEGCFTADPKAPGDPYCIVIPPPNVTGALHLGHAINNTLQDILIRAHRMKGFNVLWVPGVDHAGIATQAVVEKQLREKENKTRHDVGRDGPGGLVERIWAWKNEYGDRIVSQLKRMGCSCDWTRLRFTLDEMCAKAVRETFFKMFKDGKVFRGKRLVNWDTHLQTSISDDELYTETVKTNLWSIRYPVVGGEGSDGATERRSDGGERAGIEYVTIATTRPETMLADTAVAYHSSNPHAAFLKGKFVRLPLTNRLVPLIEDDILVDPEFGTGFVKVTPGHDPNDYAVYQRHLGKPTEIAILNLMTPDGRVAEDTAGGGGGGWSAYSGLKLETTARKKVLEDLVAAGLHNPETDVKPHEANVNYSDRSKTAIQPYLSDQWFVRMAELAEPALEAVREGKVKFFPERHGQQYLAWLGEKRDWPISRQLWWGHRIPVWTKTTPWDVTDWIQAGWTPGGQATDPKSLEEAAARIAAEPIIVFNDLNAKGWVAVVRTIHEGQITQYVCPDAAYSDSKWGRGEIEEMQTIGFVQDPDVLDTWFSSGLWPHSTLGWPEATTDLAKWYPGAVLLTGRDIITLWVARMVMMGLYNMNAVPFAHVAINPTILDGKGERMSKSKGNGVDPVEIIDMYGADAMRFTLATMATETQDVRLPVKKDGQGRNTSEKFDVGRNFCTKLWNASRFVMGQVGGGERGGRRSDEATKLSLADRWILSRLGATLADVETALATYRFDAYAKAVYDFFWRDFCDWYLEASKPAMADPARAGSTGKVLMAVLDSSLRLLHPVIPYITEEIWSHLSAMRSDRSLPGLPLPPSKRLVRAAWPTAPSGELLGDGGGAAEEFARVQEVVGALRNLRNEHKVEPRRVIDVTLVSGRFSPESAGLIELLALAKLQPGSAGANAARLMCAGAELAVEGVVDPNAEANRLAKRREELTRTITTLQARLASPAYTDKAPAKLVEQTRQQLADAQAELAKL